MCSRSRRWRAFQASAFAQPIVDGVRDFLLRSTRDIDADVTAAEAEFGVILGADQRLHRPGGLRRHQVILLGEDVEHRHLHHSQVHFPTADVDAAAKAAILAGLAFHTRVTADDVYREGISKVTAEDLATLLDLSENILGRAFCALGDGAASPIVSSLKYFRDEYVRHLESGGCPFDPHRSTLMAGALA